MSKFLIGCITLVILTLITTIKNILDKKFTEDTKQSAIFALEELTKRKLNEGEEVDLDVFKRFLKQEEEDE